MIITKRPNNISGRYWRAVIKQERNAQKVSSALAEIETYARENKNLMPAILNAVESYATLGEISQAMKNVFGEHR